MNQSDKCRSRRVRLGDKARLNINSIVFLLGLIGSTSSVAAQTNTKAPDKTESASEVVTPTPSLKSCRKKETHKPQNGNADSEPNAGAAKPKENTEGDAQKANSGGASDDKPIDEAESSIDQVTIAPCLPDIIGNWNGLRPYLESKGISFAATYLSDTLGRLSSGGRQGATYMGRVDSVLEFDLEKIMGWKDTIFHASSYDLHGVGMSRHIIGNTQSLSDLEGASLMRLNELYFEKKFLEEWSLRAGKISADSEFFISPNYSTLIGSAFGWPSVMSLNLPNGGPAYPFSAPGMRLKYEQKDRITLQAGLYDGNPANNKPGDPQRNDNNGATFRFKDPPFLIAEATLHYKLPVEMDLAGEAHFGIWRHFGRFADERLTVDGSPTSFSPNSSDPMYHRGNYGYYGIIDQKIWRWDETEKHGLYAFGRIGGAPNDRNVVDLVVDGGLAAIGFWNRRPYDRIAFGFSYSRVGAATRAADNDILLLSGDPTRKARDLEALLEATYLFAIAPGTWVQPNVQIVFHPTGISGQDALETNNGYPKVAVVAGIRLGVKY